MGKKLTHEEFVENLSNRQPKVLNTIVAFESKYIRAREHILIKDINGICKVLPYNLLSGKVPSIHSAINKVEYLKGILRNKNPKIFEYVLKFGEYNGMLTGMILKTKYGDCTMVPTSMVSGSVPTIKSAINKEEYLANELKDLVPHVFNSIFDYKNYNELHGEILVKTKYGWCISRKGNLLLGKVPTIETAINKNEYFANRACEVHGDFYNYDNVDYIIEDKLVTITCPIHGDFEQSPSNHLYGYGCSKCGIHSLQGGYNKTNAERNKNHWKEINAIVYTIKIYDEKESFYKIGITTKKVENRFSGNLPYSYITVAEIKTNLYDAVYIEDELHEKNKHNAYEPLKYFGGWTECFIEI